MKKLLILLSLSLSINTFAQLGKIKSLVGGKNDNTAKQDTTKETKPQKGNVFQKAIGKITKTVGNMAGAGAVSTIDNLNDVDIIASVGTNIYSKDIGLMVTDLLGNDWVNNGDFVMLQLASKNAFQMFTYSGAIKVNDKELKHVSMGVHTRTDAPGSGKKKFSFEKNGIVEGSFEVPVPAKNIKLVSINGQKANVKVDLTKDVELEFANYYDGPDALIRIDIVLTTMGIRSLYLVGHVKPAPKVIIPAAAFKNIETANNYNFKNCYLSVGDMQLVNAQNTTGVVPKNLKVVSGSNDGMWMEVTSSTDNSKGISFNKGNATVVKGNAAYAMPLSFAKNIAVSAFSTYGTTYLYDVEKNNWQQTTTTKTIDFPNIPDEVLDATLADMYDKFTATIAQINSANVLPASTIPATPSYADAVKFFPEEVNNDGEWRRVYKDLSPVKGLTSVGNRYFGESALLKEANADALLKVKMICQLSWESKPQMTPYLEIELVGRPNGDFRSYAGNTKYFTMTIKGIPYEIKKGKPVEYNKLFQVDAFNTSLKEALLELKAKEQATPDYEQIWKLQQINN